MKVFGADVILANNGLILPVQQSKPQAYGLWSLPGGHVEEGETFEKAVRREVREELGVNLTAITSFKTNHIKTEGGRELELRTFVGAIDDAITLKQDELMAYGWFSLASLEDMQDKLRNPIVLTLAREALGMAKGEGKFR